METDLDKAVNQAGRDIKSGMDPISAIRKAARDYDERIHDISVTLGTRANNIKLGRIPPTSIDLKWLDEATNRVNESKDKPDENFIEGLCKKDGWEMELDELDG